MHSLFGPTTAYSWWLQLSHSVAQKLPTIHDDGTYLHSLAQQLPTIHDDYTYLQDNHNKKDYAVGSKVNYGLKKRLYEETLLQCDQPIDSHWPDLYQTGSHKALAECMRN